MALWFLRKYHPFDRLPWEECGVPFAEFHLAVAAATGFGQPTQAYLDDPLPAAYKSLLAHHVALGIAVTPEDAEIGPPITKNPQARSDPRPHELEALARIRGATGISVPLTAPLTLLRAEHCCERDSKRGAQLFALQPGDVMGGGRYWSRDQFLHTTVSPYIAAGHAHSLYSVIFEIDVVHSAAPVNGSWDPSWRHERQVILGPSTFSVLAVGRRVYSRPDSPHRSYPVVRLRQLRA